MIVDCAVYRDGKRQHEDDVPVEHALHDCHLHGGFVWMGLHEPTVEEFDTVEEP